MSNCPNCKEKLVEVPRHSKRLNDDDVGTLWSTIGQWSDMTFGTPEQRGPVGALRHLALEAVEAAESNEIVEYADCLILLMDAIRRNGRTLPEVVKVAIAKMEVNKRRQWPAIGEQLSDNPIMHIKLDDKPDNG